MINKVKTAILNQFGNEQKSGAYDGKIKLAFPEKQEIRKITAYKKCKLCCLELAEKILNHTACQKEKQEYNLAKEYIYEYETCMKLPDRVTHDRLFEAYPQLKNVNLYFDKIPAASAYYPKQNAIVINPTRSKAEQRRSVMREIQNAILHIEGLSTVQKQSE